jgi:hypothetical protein
MKICFLLAIVAALVCAAAPAQGPPEFQGWMEAASQNSGRLILRLQEKDAADATVAANNLQNVFGQVAAFFEEKQSAGAAKYARDAQLGFQKVEQLLSDGQLDAAYQTAQSTRANCEHCHREYRERLADGTYRIKD